MSNSTGRQVRMSSIASSSSNSNRRTYATETLTHYQGEEVDAFACRCPVCGYECIGRVVYDTDKQENNQLAFTETDSERLGSFWNYACEHLYDTQSQSNYVYDATFEFILIFDGDEFSEDYRGYVR